MEIVDSEGVPIHGDILQDNRYGPAIPGVDILQNLSNFTQNCFLTYGLNRDGYEKYEIIPQDPNTCDISDKLLNYSYQQNIRTSDVPATTVPKLRILLKELHALNELSNRFFQEREEKAVEILERNSTPDTEYSMRLNYMNRRQYTANSNTIALILSIVIIGFTLFTGGYLYFAGKLSSPLDLAIVFLPIAVLGIALMLGYVFIKDYAIFLS
jgi:hypothetical protein